MQKYSYRVELGQSSFARIAATIFVLSGVSMLAFGVGSSAAAQTIDFETAPLTGPDTVAGQSINTQYSSLVPSVTFSLLDGNFAPLIEDPVVAKVGAAPPTSTEPWAFYGILNVVYDPANGKCYRDTTVSSNPNNVPQPLEKDILKCSFLAYPNSTGVGSASNKKLLISYDSPVNGAQGTIIDIDTNPSTNSKEIWVVNAHSVPYPTDSTTEIPGAQVVLCSPELEQDAILANLYGCDQTNPTGDGIGTVFSVFGNGIRSLVVAYDNSQSTPEYTPGLAFDNFTPSVEPSNDQGFIKVCKVAGEGVAVGTEFPINVGGTIVSVPAGPPPGGYCKVVEGTFEVGSTITAEELEPDNTAVVDIMVEPSDRVNEISLAEGKIAINVGVGVTEATWTNVSTEGWLEICKVGDVKGDFEFTVEDADGFVGTYTAPAGACTPAILVHAGNVTITENSSQRYAMVDCYTQPDVSDQQSCDDWVSVVNVDAGNISNQTIAFIENVGRMDRRESRFRQHSDEGTALKRLASLSPSQTHIIGNVPSATMLSCAAELTNGFRACTAKVFGKTVKEVPSGGVQFVSGKRTMAILPLNADGTATLALPVDERDLESWLVAKYVDDNLFAESTSLLQNIVNDHQSSMPEWVIPQTNRPERANPPSLRNVYAPGAPAPTDNEAADLNRIMLDRFKRNVDE